MYISKYLAACIFSLLKSIEYKRYLLQLTSLSKPFQIPCITQSDPFLSGFDWAVHGLWFGKHSKKVGKGLDKIIELLIQKSLQLLGGLKICTMINILEFESRLRTCNQSKRMLMHQHLLIRLSS